MAAPSVYLDIAEYRVARDERGRDFVVSALPRLSPAARRGGPRGALAPPQAPRHPG